MSDFQHPTQEPPLPEEHADLTALADGSLPPGRAAAIERRVAESPELAAALAQQRQAVAMLREAVAATEAPLALRERLERDRAKLAAPRRRRRIFSLATAGALAAVAVLAVMVGLSGGPGAPSVAEAAALSAKPPTATAPADPGTPQLLNVAQSGVAFPNWEAKFGWKAVGSRTDKLDGREATTVFYRKGGKTIAYTIVSGKALDDPDNFSQVTLQNVPLKVFPNQGTKDVTWLRSGHSCVMSGTGVPTAKLLELASWPGKGAVQF
jgi:anti-sigma factor RsiW